MVWNDFPRNLVKNVRNLIKDYSHVTKILSI